MSANALRSAVVIAASVLLVAVAIGASFAAVRPDAVAPLLATYALLSLLVGVSVRARS